MDTHTHPMPWSHAAPAATADNAGRRTSRILMAVLALVFAAAAFIHAGALGRAYDNYYAHILEMIVAVVLFVALVGTWIRPSWLRFVALTGEGFAFGAMIFALFAIAMGGSPVSAIDIAFDVVMALVLFWGLRVAQRLRAGDAPEIKPPNLP